MKIDNIILDIIEHINKTDVIDLSDLNNLFNKNPPGELVHYIFDEYAYFENYFLIVINDSLSPIQYNIIQENINNILVDNIVILNQSLLNNVINDTISTKINKLDSYSEIQKQFFQIIYLAATDSISDIYFILQPSASICEVKVKSLGQLKTFKQVPTEIMEKIFPAIYNISDATDPTYIINDYQNGTINNNVLPEYLKQIVSGIRLQFNPIYPYPAKELVCRLMYVMGENTKISLTELGFTENQEKTLLTSPTGLTIFSGPTGSGKSTAMRGIILNIIEKTNNTKSIYSIEDPVEVVIPSIFQLTIPNARSEEERKQNNINALRALTRSDMDIGIIGEIRDYENFNLAYSIASSGHPLYATFHAYNALSILTRSISMGMQNFQVQDPTIFSKLVSQRLVPILCKKCKVKQDFDYVKTTTTSNLPEVMEQYVKKFGGDLNNLYSQGKGCDCCNHLGITSRTVIAEVIHTNDEFFEIYKKDGALVAEEHWKNNMGGESMMMVAIKKCISGNVDVKSIISPSALGEGIWKI